jgi:hypothetical protein
MGPWGRELYAGGGTTMTPPRPEVGIAAPFVQDKAAIKCARS